MTTVAPMAPSSLRWSASGRSPSTTSGPEPRTASPTAAGRGTDAPGEGHAQRATAVLRLTAGGRAALDEHPLDEVHARAAEEASHERVGRLRIERLGRRHLLQLPLAHHGDAVAHRHGLHLVVGDVQRGGREPRLQLDDVGPGLHPQRGVEVRQWLVHEEDEGLAHNGPGQGHPLALATRELPGLAVDQRGQPEGLGGLLDLGRSLLLGHATLAERELNVLGHRQVGVERVALEDHGDVAVLGVHIVDNTVTDGDGAAGHVLEPGHHAQCRRLAAARRAEEHQQLAVGDVQGQVVDCGGVTELLGDPVEADLCQRAPFAFGRPVCGHGSSLCRTVANGGRGGTKTSVRPQTAGMFHPIDWAISLQVGHRP